MVLACPKASARTNVRLLFSVMQASFLNWEGSSSDRYNMYIRVDAGVDTDDTDSQILGMMMHGC